MAAAAVLGMATLGVGAPAPALSTSTAAPTPAVELLHQAPTLTLGAPVLHLDLQAPTSTTQFVFELARPVTSPAEFQDVVAGGRLPPLVDSPAIVPTSETTRVGTRFGVDVGIQTPTDPVALRKTLRVREAGVYPLRVTARPAPAGDDASFVTWLVVHDPTAVPRPEAVAWVWQLDTPPTADTHATPGSEVQRLEHLATLTSAGIGVPMSLVTSARTLEQWHDSVASGAQTEFDALRTRLRSPDRSLIAAPWVRLDPLALSRAGFTTEYRSARERSVRVLHDRFGLDADPNTAWFDNADTAALDAERALGTRHAGFAATALAPIDSALTDQRFAIAKSSLDGVATSTAANGFLFDGDRAPALRAQEFAAALAVEAAADPVEHGGLLVSTPLHWTGDSRLMNAVLQVLDDHTLAAPVTLGDLFGVLTPGTDGRGGPLVRTLQPRTPEPLALRVSDLRATRRRIDGMTAMSADGRTIDESTDAAFLTALSDQISNTDAGRLLATANQRVAQFVAGVTASAQATTLTSEQSRIPVRFTNSTGAPVRVIVALRSPKLVQVGGPILTTLPANPIHSTALITVKVKGSGQFRAELILTSPNGSMPVGTPTEVSVNSSVFGSYGIWLTWGALGFLGLWWAHHFWRVRHPAALPSNP